MSEPKTKAVVLHEVVPDVHHWTIRDERIDFRSDAYAVDSEEGLVLIDPLPVEEGLLERIARPSAIVLTGGFHQRAAWSLRERYDVKVHVPEGAQGLDGKPDAVYVDGDELPGGLIALHRPGPTQPHYALLLAREGEPVVLFCADLLMRADTESEFAFVPDEHQDDPALTRESVRNLLDLDVAILCPAHGAPAPGGTAAMRRALEKDAG